MNKEKSVMSENHTKETKEMYENHTNLSEWQRRNKRKQVLTIMNQPSLTKQEFAYEQDINNIIKKFHTTGELPKMRQGFYADVSEIPDYHEAMNIVARANQNFASLPSQLRTKFDNDPSKMLEWISDPQNAQEAVELGLLQSKDVKISSAPKTSILGQSKAQIDEPKTMEAPKNDKSA